MKTMIRALLVATSFACVGLSGLPSQACLRAMEEPMPKQQNVAMQIAQAEQALDDGQLGNAAGAVLRNFPAIRAAKPGADPLQNRGLRIMALASARSDGALATGPALVTTSAWRGADDAQKRANLEWSVATLRAMNALRKNDASLQADLGEALAKLPATQQESLQILTKLANEDLIGSPHAFAALARLRLAAGDATGSAEAVKKCEGMASSPAICQPKKPAAAPAPPSKPVAAADRA
jgi:hypothetical protein